MDFTKAEEVLGELVYYRSETSRELAKFYKDEDEEEILETEKDMLKLNNYINDIRHTLAEIITAKDKIINEQSNELGKLRKESYVTPDWYAEEQAWLNKCNANRDEY